MQRDSDGYVIDNLKSCGPFDDDGNYNGLTSVIEDQLGLFSNNILPLSVLICYSMRKALRTLEIY